MNKKIISLFCFFFFGINLFGSFCQNAISAEVAVPADDRKVPTVRQLTWPTATEDVSTVIAITLNTTQLLRFDRVIVRSAISNPDVCDITQVGQKELLINAKKAGVSNLLVWDENNQVVTYNLDSTIYVYKLYELLIGVDPKGEFNIVPFNDTVAVYGKTATSVKLKQIQELVKAYDKNALCYVTLRESKQVLLEVRFADVTRTGSKDFKFDMDAMLKYSYIGSFTGQTDGSSTDRTDDDDHRYVPDNPHGTLGYPLPALGTQDTASFFFTYFTRKFGITHWLKLLETKNVLKVIARPNLVAKDGEEAKFLVGGEVPSVVVTNNEITISYKEYGTQLKFTPEVLEDDMLRIKVESEVSELDSATSVSLSTMSISGLSKRTYSTVTEMRDGQTLLIGGIIKQKIQKIERKTPVLGDLPVFKYLFKSTADTRVDTELLVIITPHVIKPFETGEDKIYNDKEKLLKSVQVFNPTYPDPQADLINSYFRQGEPLKQFTLEETQNASKFSRDMAKKLEEKTKQEKLANQKLEEEKARQQKKLQEKIKADELNRAETKRKAEEVARKDAEKKRQEITKRQQELAAEQARRNALKTAVQKTAQKTTH